MATLVIRRLAILSLAAFLVSCAGDEHSSKDFAAYRKNPQTCSAAGYFAKLSGEEQLRYVFGALHVRPQAACVTDLIAKQDFNFLLKLQDEITQRGGIFDRYAFIDAVTIKNDSGDLSDAELRKLSLDDFCVEIDATANKCPYLLQQLRNQQKDQ